MKIKIIAGLTALLILGLSSYSQTTSLPETYFKLAQSLFSEKKYQDARMNFKKAIRCAGLMNKPEIIKSSRDYLTRIYTFIGDDDLENELRDHSLTFTPSQSLFKVEDISPVYISLHKKYKLNQKICGIKMACKFSVLGNNPFIAYREPKRTITYAQVLNLPVRFNSGHKKFSIPFQVCLEMDTRETELSYKSSDTLTFDVNLIEGGKSAPSKKYLFSIFVPLKKAQCYETIRNYTITNDDRIAFSSDWHTFELEVQLKKNESISFSQQKCFRKDVNWLYMAFYNIRENSIEYTQYSSTAAEPMTFECDQCKGSGANFDVSASTCLKCSGSGSTGVNYFTRLSINCSACGGTGRVVKKSTGKCSYCSGKGYVKKDIPFEVMDAPDIEIVNNTDAAVYLFNPFSNSYLPYNKADGKWFSSEYKKFPIRIIYKSHTDTIYPFDVNFVYMKKIMIDYGDIDKTTLSILGD